MWEFDLVQVGCTYFNHISVLLVSEAWSYHSLIKLKRGIENQLIID